MLSNEIVSSLIFSERNGYCVIFSLVLENFHLISCLFQFAGCYAEHIDFILKFVPIVYKLNNELKFHEKNIDILGNGSGDYILKFNYSLNTMEPILERELLNK